MIYCFVLGCCMWKESFHLDGNRYYAGGIFLASLTSLLTLCVVLVPVELYQLYRQSVLQRADTVLSSDLWTVGKRRLLVLKPGLRRTGALVQIAGSLALAYAGYLGVIFYVVPKWLRVVLAIFIPITLFAGIPSLILVLPHPLIEELLNAFLLFSACREI